MYLNPIKKSYKESWRKFIVMSSALLMFMIMKCKMIAWNCNYIIPSHPPNFEWISSMPLKVDSVLTSCLIMLHPLKVHLQFWGTFSFLFNTSTYALSITHLVNPFGYWIIQIYLKYSSCKVYSQYFMYFSSKNHRCMRLMSQRWRCSRWVFIYFFPVSWNICWFGCSFINNHVNDRKSWLLNKSNLLGA